eukprot:PLAT6569.1.p2 GENE.PLAT6569.1~~PLAT6569.1.p2  ORF type:complete len:450 (+),score=234.53 PLAT6569.1:34-1383(+)
MGKGRGSGKLDEEQAISLGACAFCCCLLPSIIMFALSFSIIQPRQYGLFYNGVAFEWDDTQVYTSGRYFAGLGNWFITYPKSLRYLEFSNSTDGGSRNKPISAWTFNGQEIVVELGMYYRLEKDRIPDMYLNHETDYLFTLENMAQEALKERTTTFSTIEFFTNRTQVNRVLHEHVNATLYKHMNVEVPLFNLLGIDLPDEFEDAVVDKIIQVQEKLILEYEQESSVTRQQINVINANAQNRINIILARREAEGTLIRANANADAQRAIVQAQAVGYQSLGNSLGLTSREVHEVKVAGNFSAAASAPQFTISFNGSTTAALSWPPLASAVSDALVAAGIDDVTVTGGPLASPIDWSNATQAAVYAAGNSSFIWQLEWQSRDYDFAAFPMTTATAGTGLTAADISTQRLRMGHSRAAAARNLLQYLWAKVPAEESAKLFVNFDKPLVDAS